LTASGQSIIVAGVAASPGTSGAVVEFDLVLAREAECPRFLAQQSCACIEAQASPAATIRVEPAGDAALLDALAVIMFPQPSKQPAPAIQKATASANDTRTILIEERNLIAKQV
jgi:hypothetical protein